jgi:hypothetical protein
MEAQGGVGGGGGCAGRARGGGARPARPPAIPAGSPGRLLIPLPAPPAPPPRPPCPGPKGDSLASQGERHGTCVLRRPLPGRRTNSLTVSDTSLRPLSMSDVSSASA